MTRYRRKPIEVEAWQVGSDEPVPKWLESAMDVGTAKPYRNGYWWVVGTLEGNQRANDGDYIINRGDGFFSISPAIYFEEEYDKARPYYLEVYDWAFCGMEGTGGYEFEMFSTIWGAIEKYMKAVAE